MNEIISTIGVGPAILLALAVTGCLAPIVVMAGGWHLPDVDDAYDAARQFNCPVCDDRQPEAACDCVSDCGRPNCPYAVLDFLNGPDDAFNAAIARLHADLEAGQ